MDTWPLNGQIGMPLTALALACIVLSALPSPSQAQSDAHAGGYNADDDSDVVVYGGHLRHNTGTRP